MKVYDIWLQSGYSSNCETYRYNQIQALLQSQVFQQDLANVKSIPVIVAGDFNNVTHLDVTTQTEQPPSLAMDNASFIDTYRATNPFEIEGYTWSPMYGLTKRIDYIYINGNGVEIVNSSVIIEDNTVQRFPSDHGAVITTFQF